MDKQFSVEGNISYSPLVDAKNVDQHLLREKVNTGDLDGSSWMFNIKGKYDFTEHWFMAASYDYKKMKTDGTMSAEFSDTYLYIYGVIPNHTVSEELDSTQHAVALNMGYSF